MSLLRLRPQPLTYGLVLRGPKASGHASLQLSIAQWLHVLVRCVYYLRAFRHCSDLSLNNLTGPMLDAGAVPQKWGSLTLLALSSNELTGSIPASIASLKKLSVLDLSRNALTGQVPSSVYASTALVALIVSENDLNGTLTAAGGFYDPADFASSLFVKCTIASFDEPPS